MFLWYTFSPAVHTAQIKGFFFFFDYNFKPEDGTNMRGFQEIHGSVPPFYITM